MRIRDFFLMFVIFDIVFRRFVIVLCNGILILIRSGILDEFINIVVIMMGRFFFCGMGSERYRNGSNVVDC